MSQTAVLEGKSETMSASYPVLTVNGQKLQMHEDMILEFITNDDKRITVVVTAYAPLHPKFNIKALERWTDGGNQKTIFDIIPASVVQLGDSKVDEFIGVGYNEQQKKLIFLIPAIDNWGPTRQNLSFVKYRSYGTSSPLGKARSIVSVNVVGAPEVETVASS